MMVDILDREYSVNGRVKRTRRVTAAQGMRSDQERCVVLWRSVKRVVVVSRKLACGRVGWK